MALLLLSSGGRALAQPRADAVLVLVPDAGEGEVARTLREAVTAQLSGIEIEARFQDERSLQPAPQVATGAVAIPPAGSAAPATPADSALAAAGQSEPVAAGATTGGATPTPRGDSEGPPPHPPGPRELIATGKELADREGAIGVFWLDTSNPQEWLLYLIDPARKRLLVRQAGSAAASPAAAVESVAVIIKGAAVALAQGRSFELLPAGEEAGKGSRWIQVGVGSSAEPPPQSRQPPAPGGEQEASGALLLRVDSRPGAAESEPQSRGLRLAVAYRGANFAAQDEWQSGLGLWAGWLFTAGPFLGAGCTLAEQSQVSSPAAELSLTRIPLELFAGYRYPIRRFALHGELAAVLEILNRRTGSPATGFQSSPDETRVVFGLLPRARVEWSPIEPVSLFAGFGIAFLMNSFKYVWLFEGEKVLLAPHPVRAEIEAGLSILL